uniref:Putative monooxygenase n=1 Tax=Penicillium expansum TaxID=27334 RepID=A8KNF2_PENEN|nr:putative monooxygenase [Penicillium expansum]
MDAIFGNIVLDRLLSQLLVFGLGVLGVVLVVLSISVRGLQRRNAFCNDQAKLIKELKITDLRLKLLQSANISQQGRALAGTEPYLITCGKYQELVISQPAHVHDFYRSDYKVHGKPLNFNFGGLFGRFMGTAVGLRYGDEWRKIRLHFDPPFKFHEALYWQLLELSHLHDQAVHEIMIFRKSVDKFLSEWRSLNRAVIHNARGGKWDCPVEEIARSFDPSKDMTEEDFLSTLGEVLFANVDVSASVLSTTMTNLAANPSIQTELRSEISKWKSQGEGGFSKYLTNSGTLLHRVIMESMRLSPAFWFSMPETTGEAKQIGGYHVPANTTVIIDNRRLNEEGVTWGDDGAQYRPDRFLEVAPQALRCGFMRYGTSAASGRCLGKHLADLIFKLTTVAVVERFRLESLGVSEKQLGFQNRDAVDVRLIKI